MSIRLRNSIGIVVFVTIFLTSSWAASDDFSQSPRVLASEKARLATLMNKRTLSCVDQNKIETLKIIAKNGKLTIASTYGDAAGDADSTLVEQLSVGSIIMLSLAGPDSEAGTAVVLIPSASLSRDTYTAAEAIIYQETGPGDGTGRLHQLKCSLK